jgi:hypothetical protein
MNSGNEYAVDDEDRDLSDSSIKYKKTKTECSKQVYSVTPNSNSLKLKITKSSKLSETVEMIGKESSTDTPPKKSKRVLFMGSSPVKVEVPQSHNMYSSNSYSDMPKLQKTKIEFEDRLNDQSNYSPRGAYPNKSSNLPQFLKAKSTPAPMPGLLLPKQHEMNFLNSMQSPDVDDFLPTKYITASQSAPASAKKIGTLTVDERKVKIEKYLAKRKKRTWNKKISYDCRKRVADSRLRIKGRFVTKEQAVALLGSEQSADIDKFSTSELKDMLNQKFGCIAAVSKKRDNSQSDKDSLRDSKDFDLKKEEDFTEFTLDDQQEDGDYGFGHSQHHLLLGKEKDYEKNFLIHDELDFKIEDEMKYEDDLLKGFGI